MLQVFVDESGQAANEFVTVVAAVIVRPEQSELVIRRIEALVSKIPEQFRQKYPTFHVLNIVHDKEFRNLWTLSDRLHVIAEMMSLPRKLNLPISVAWVRRETARDEVVSLPEEFVKNVPPMMLVDNVHHMAAFASCIAQADKWIRQYGEANENGSVVAENFNDSRMKTYLKAAVGSLRGVGLQIKPSDTHIVIDGSEDYTRPPPSEFGVYKVTRIVEPIDFVGKHDEPMLQLADSVAYGYRRYVENKRDGELFLRAIIDRLPRNRIVFDFARSSTSFFWYPPFAAGGKILPIWRAKVRLAGG